MTVDDITTALRDITDAEFEHVFDEMILIRQERQARPQVAQAEARLVAELQQAGKLDKPDTVTVDEAIANPDVVAPWENPLTDHSKMYLEDAVVTNIGRYWLSTYPGLNSWEPGAHGVDENIWLDITHLVKPDAPGTPTDNADNTDTGAVDTATHTIPYAPGLPVQPGDILAFEGAHYRVLQPHTTADRWRPDEAHSLYTRL